MFEHLEARLALAGTIQGSIFDDANRDGARQSGEAGLSGTAVYLDANGNGQLDPGEASTTSGAGGAYAFGGLAAGGYTVRVVGVPGSTLTTPTTPIDGGGTAIPLATRRDVISDSRRNQLLITASDGKLYRYDLASKSFLAPIQVGVSLGGGDISQDGKFLYVTDFNRGPNQGVIHKVDLDAGTVVDLSYDLFGGEGGSFDLKIAANGIAAISARYEGSGGVRLRFLDLATDAISVVPNRIIQQDTSIRRGADRSLLTFEESNISSGPMFSYDARTGSFSPKVETWEFLDKGLHAVSRDGTLAAVTIGGVVSIVTPTFGTVKLLGKFNGGMAFDPVRDVFYVADGVSGKVSAFSTRTWAELARFDTGETPSGAQASTFGNLQLKVGDDGKTLVLTTATGLRTYSLGNAGRTATVVDGATVAGQDFGLVGTTPAEPDPILRLSAGQQVAEGNVGATDVVFRVTLSRPGDRTVAVGYRTVDGTAKAGSDYQAASGTLTFAPGETAKDVTVRVTSDDAFEPDESLTLELASPSNAFVSGVAGSATLSIANDDPDLPIVFIGTTPFEATEGSQGQLIRQYLVSLSRYATTPVTVRYHTVDGSAKAGSDYTAVSGTLTIPINQAGAYIALPINGDTEVESDETFQLVISAPTNARLSDNTIGNVWIINDDVAVTPSVSITPTAASFREGDSGTPRAAFRVRIDNPTDAPLTVPYRTVDGSAKAGSDFLATSGVLTFQPFQFEQIVEVPLIPDAAIEGDETFGLLLSPPSGATLQGNGLATATITDDDTADGSTLSFSAGSYRVSEASGKVVVTVVRNSGTAAGASAVLATSDGTARAGVNYQAINALVSFAAGQRSATVEIPILRDGASSGPLSLDLRLVGLSQGVSLGGISASKVQIDDVDPRPASRVTGVRLTQRKRALTSLILDFDGDLDPASAPSAMGFTLTKFNAKGKPAGTIAIGSARYDASTRKVTLLLKKPASWNGVAKLAAPGLKNSAGGALSGVLATLTSLKGKITATT